MKFRATPLLLLPVLPVLSACQDQQARQQNAELTKRVTALEAEVSTLKAAQPQNTVTINPAAFEAKAAAQNCANDLTLTLETFHRDSIDHRYPPEQQLELPPSCASQRVNWSKLEAQAYTFTVMNEQGQALARQSGP